MGGSGTSWEPKLVDQAVMERVCRLGVGGGVGWGHEIGVERRGHPGGRGFCCRWLGLARLLVEQVTCGENTVCRAAECHMCCNVTCTAAASLCGSL